MNIQTHRAIDHALCGRPVRVEADFCRVELTTTPDMAVDASGLVHGGFIFGLADHAAMVAVNHPNVVLGAADDLGVPVPGTSLIFQLYRTLQERGLGHEGNHALIKALEYLAGFEVQATEV